MSDRPYGCLAQFADAQALLAAVNALRARGYTRMEAYTPYAVEGLAEKLGPVRDGVAPAMLAGGLFGGLGTLALEYYSAVIDYPLNIGGRPLASWPAFIPSALEMTFLFAMSAGVLAMLVGNRLPRLYHALFNASRFAQASRDGFFVVVRADDPAYRTGAVLRALHALSPLAVEEVPA